jgi:hypothetical protein
MIQFKDLQVGDRVKTHYSGWATVVSVGCYNGTMVRLKCDNPKWACPYFYESEIDLKQTISLTSPI